MSDIEADVWNNPSLPPVMDLTFDPANLHTLLGEM